LSPKIVDWNASGLDTQKSADASQRLKTILDTYDDDWGTYILNDLDSKFTFGTRGGAFVIEGQNPTYHFFDPDSLRETAGFNELLTTRFGADRIALQSLNPAVYDTAYKPARWASFFRYMKANRPAGWATYLASLEHATNVLAVETPVAWVRKK